MTNIINNNGSITEQKNNELVFTEGDVRKTVGRILGGRREFAVTDENVYKLHPELFVKSHDVAVIKAGEDSKTLDSVANICRQMLSAGLNRNCTVVAYGGGVVGDMAGFCASVFMRGVNFINVPTTLLSQVDSAIGGKTGVNLDGYKNMIGAFKMPSHIVICPQLLNTLPDREWRCGMGELIKTAALCPELYGFVQSNIKSLSAHDELTVYKAVKAAAEFKKGVTDRDPCEKGERIILNLGHTVGHALEKLDEHKLSHGEYVMLGLKIELAMAESKSEFTRELNKMLDEVGMPNLPEVDSSAVADVAKTDKKNSSGKITLIGSLGAGQQYTVQLSGADFAAKYDLAVKNLIKDGELQ